MELLDYSSDHFFSSALRYLDQIIRAHPDHSAMSAACGKSISAVETQEIDLGWFVRAHVATEEVSLYSRSLRYIAHDRVIQFWNGLAKDLEFGKKLLADSSCAISLSYQPVCDDLSKQLPMIHFATSGERFSIASLAPMSRPQPPGLTASRAVETFVHEKIAHHDLNEMSREERDQFNQAIAARDARVLANNQLLGRVANSLHWTQVTRPMLADGFGCSVLARASEIDGPLADLTADPNTALRRGGSGDLAFGKLGLPHLDSGQSDDGWVMTTGFSGEWQWNRTLNLGKGAGTATSVQGALVVVISNTGDFVRISSAGIEIFRRSVSTGVPMVKLDLNAVSGWTMQKALSLREIDVCDNGVAKKMLVLASAPY